MPTTNVIIAVVCAVALAGRRLGMVVHRHNPAGAWKGLTDETFLS